MSDQQDPRPDRPVLNGLVALVAVALGVGLVLGLVALVGSNVLGLGDDDGAPAADSSVRDSMVIPSEFESTGDGGPRITLATDDPDETQSGSATDPESSESSEPTESESAKDGEISLQAEQNAVASGDRIYFSGVYPGGEGAILWVQRWQAGAWVDFPASLGVSNETFRSYVFTGQGGVNRFRVIDRDTDTVSNEIRVKVG